MLYADASAVVRAYLVDEPDQPELARRLLEASEPVVTSELTRIEFAGAVTRAERVGRIRVAKELIGLFDRDSGTEGRISLVPLRREPVLATAHRISVRYGLSALDSLHLAVAMNESDSAGSASPFVFVTRDEDQAATARAEGLDVG